MTERKAQPPKDAAQKEVQTAVDKAADQGFIGVEVDPTPNEHYSVSGVLAGKPVPETDPEAAAAVRRAALGH